MNTTDSSSHSGVTWPTVSLAGERFLPGCSRIAVLGAGIMGPGIAGVFAEHGFEVDLCEISDLALEQGIQALTGALALKVSLGLLDPKDREATLSRVTPHLNAEGAVGRAALIVEAVTENREVKREVFHRILACAKRNAAVWSNTSTLDVFELAPAGLRERLLVAHWFAPPHILPLVELVAGESTHSRLAEESVAVLKALGKTPITLNRFLPGFVINRLLRALGREAFYMIEQGVLSAEDLDVAVRASLAPRMQVLGLMQRYDFTGLHLSLRNLQDPEIVDAPLDRTPELLCERVRCGELGVSTGKGFYDYDGRSPVELQSERDRRLWSIARAVPDLLFDPKPI